jgi:hypothetical protein
VGVLAALQLGFKLWMVVDSIQRLGFGSWWPYFIFFFPLGSWIYFLVEKWPELSARGSLSFERPPAVEKLRYAADHSPSLENEVRLATALLDAGQADEAARLFERAVRQDDAFVRAHHGLGLAALARDEPAAAVTSFERVRQLDRRYADWGIWLDLALAQKAAGDPAAATATLRELHRSQPRLEHSVALARALHGQAKDDEARALLERALEDDQHAPRHVSTAAKAWEKEASALLAKLG